MGSKATLDFPEVNVSLRTVSLAGSLTIPEEATGIVAFAHGSGSSRFSSRNRYVADLLNEAHLATLLFDLLTEEEHKIDQYTRHLRFDIGLLAERLVGAVDWMADEARTRKLTGGLFGASTGSAAALVAAAERPALVRALVSRGGRPDLADEDLPRVQCPVLLIVGGLDTPVIELNRDAAARLRSSHRMEIVPGASHLFEEPGTLTQAAMLARDWFIEHLK